MVQVVRLGPSGPPVDVAQVASPLSSVLFVDAGTETPADEQNGAADSPFATLAAAVAVVAAAPAESVWTIYLAPTDGFYDGDGLVLPGNRLLTIEYLGGNPSQNQGITGTLEWALSGVSSLTLVNGSATLIASGSGDRSDLFVCNFSLVAEDLPGVRVLVAGVQPLAPDLNVPVSFSCAGELGSLQASNANLTLPLVCESLNASGCNLITGVANTIELTTDAGARFFGCRWDTDANVAITFSGDPGVVEMDGATLVSWQQVGGDVNDQVGESVHVYSPTACYRVTPTVPAILDGDSADVAVTIDELVDIDSTNWYAGLTAGFFGEPEASLGVLAAWLSDDATGEVTIRFGALGGNVAGGAADMVVILAISPRPPS